MGMADILGRVQSSSLVYFEYNKGTSILVSMLLRLEFPQFFLRVCPAEPRHLKDKAQVIQQVPDATNPGAMPCLSLKGFTLENITDRSSEE